MLLPILVLLLRLFNLVFCDLLFVGVETQALVVDESADEFFVQLDALPHLTKAVLVVVFPAPVEHLRALGQIVVLAELLEVRVVQGLGHGDSFLRREGQKLPKKIKFQLRCVRYPLAPIDLFPALVELTLPLSLNEGKSLLVVYELEVLITGESNNL